MEVSFEEVALGGGQERLGQFLGFFAEKFGRLRTEASLTKFRPQTPLDQHLLLSHLAFNFALR